MIEIPQQLAVMGELQDAVLVALAADPDEALAIHNHRLQRRWPFRIRRPRSAPGLHNIPLLIGLDQLGPAYAAERRGRIAFGGQLDGQRRATPVQEPDVIGLLFDKHPGDLLHAPAVGERFGPERIDAVLRRAIRIQSLPRYHLCVSDGRGDIRGDQAQSHTDS